jgi:transcriptional regulator with XRE-family HTH domain
MIGSEIRALRERRGLTQAEVAEAAGISRATLTKIEAETNYPSLGTLEALAECLKMTVTITPHTTRITPH